MQFQVDAGDSRPTFFELIAADRLVPSLRAALVYSLGVLAARRPGLTRILDHEAEAFAALMLLVETHSFATSDGSLAEGLYGLQRSRRVGGVGGGDAGGGSRRRSRRADSHRNSAPVTIHPVTTTGAARGFRDESVASSASSPSPYSWACRTRGRNSTRCTCDCPARTGWERRARWGPQSRRPSWESTRRPRSRGDRAGTTRHEQTTGWAARIYPEGGTRGEGRTRVRRVTAAHSWRRPLRLHSWRLQELLAIFERARRMRSWRRTRGSTPAGRASCSGAGSGTS